MSIFCRFKSSLLNLKFSPATQLIKYCLWGYSAEICIFNFVVMEYRSMLHLQKCLYFNQYMYAIWFIVVIFFLYVKLDKMDHLSKYLSVTIFILLFIIEVTRLYLAHYGNLSSRVPELAGFLMLTIFMQMPLVSFFVFNPYLLSTHTEYVLHISLWLITILEIIFGFLALKHASSVAKSIYLSHTRQGKY